MYALLRTNSKLINSYSFSINQYTRKQSRGFLVEVVVDVEDEKVKLFEELSGVKLQTSEEFQGKMTLNKIGKEIAEMPYDEFERNCKEIEKMASKSKPKNGHPQIKTLIQNG